MHGQHDIHEERDVPWQAGGDAMGAKLRQAIYYRRPDTPEGHFIKEYPSGLLQLVRFIGVEEQIVKYSLMSP